MDREKCTFSQRSFLKVKIVTKIEFSYLEIILDFLDRESSREVPRGQHLRVLTSVIGEDDIEYVVLGLVDLCYAA